jgi:hypothetical protein
VSIPEAASSIPHDVKAMAYENQRTVEGRRTFCLLGCCRKNLKIRIYQTIILPVVLYARETRSLTLREKHSLGVFENRELRRIFGQKRDEVTGGWRKLHNEELHDLYSLPSIIRIIKLRRLKWTGHVA